MCKEKEKILKFEEDKEVVDKKLRNTHRQVMSMYTSKYG